MTEGLAALISNLISTFFECQLPQIYPGQDMGAGLARGALYHDRTSWDAMMAVLCLWALLTFQDSPHPR